jgi:hypothetical protein
MKLEFKRFGLEKLGRLTAVLQLLGGLGLLIGLMVIPLLVFSAGGLTLLMAIGVLVRIRVRDSFWITIPALFYLFLNACILILSLNNSFPILL